MVEDARRSSAPIIIAGAFELLARLPESTAVSTHEFLKNGGVDVIDTDTGVKLNELSQRAFLTLYRNSSDRRRAQKAARLPRKAGSKSGTAYDRVRRAGIEAARQAANRYAVLMAPKVAEVQTALAESQKDSFTAIALALNERGYQTRRGKLWKPEQVRRLLRRIGELS